MNQVDAHDAERVRALAWEPLLSVARRRDLASAWVLCITLPPAPEAGGEEEPDVILLEPGSRRSSWGCVSARAR